MFKLAEQTGGDAVKADNAVADFKHMIERIRTRYSLSYHAPESQPGAFRHIGVALSAGAQRRYPFAEIRARHGYYVQ